MGKQIAVSLLLIFLIFFLPWLWGGPARAPEPRPEPQPAEDLPPQPEEDDPAPDSGSREPGRDSTTVLNLLADGKLQQTDMETYLMGVVRAEMPAAFEMEALKAQAVAARTYTLYKLQSGGNHGETADVCTDHTCCQAYLNAEAARANWGDRAAAYEAKVESAVRETDGEAILYGGVPILAVFHSSSAGRTRAAGEVWVNDLPYLRPVDSPEPGDRIPNYYSRVEFPAEELKAKLLAAFPEADLSGGMEGWLKDPAADSAGNVGTVSVGGVAAKGTQVRAALGLRSACFTWEAQEGGMAFFVTGYGHGVGLSQYGASAMAAAGAGYREILTHYYTGVTVEPYQG